MQKQTQKIMVRDLVPSREDVQSVFLVKFIQLMEAKDGKNYINIILGDATGDIEARIWNGVQEIVQRHPRGSYVSATGKIHLFQGRKQLIIQKLESVEESKVNRDDFVVKSLNNADEMYERLTRLVEGLGDVYIRDLLVSLLTDPEISRRLKVWQAGKSVHHAYESGLLEHILSCSELAVHLSAHYKVNASYVVAGCILHDMGKIYELSDGQNCEYTEEGKLVGHLVKGPELVDKFSHRIKDFPYAMKLHLKHILLSHHGEYEYGSPKIPQTSEAMLVHLIDMMDSKMNVFETTKRTDQTSGRWSSFIKHMDRTIYKEELPTFTQYANAELSTGLEDLKNKFNKK